MTSVPSNLTMWAGIVGFLMPIVISIIKQSGWSDAAKSVLAFACCLAAAVGTAYFSGNFIGQDVVTCFLITFTIAIGSYYGFYKPTGISGAIEKATSFGRG